MSSRSLRRSMILNMFLVASMAFGGLLLGGATTSARADYCENDACSRVCSFGSCTGECYDHGSNQKNCDMEGSDCKLTSCNVS